MNLKEIVLAGSLLLLTSLAFSQDKLKFDVYTKGDKALSPRLNSSSIRVNPNEIDCSFLFGIYSMKFKKVNDSTYHEIVKTSFLLALKEELFDYSFNKDSSYTLKRYSAIVGKPREEKEALEGTIYDKKYKDLLGLIGDFEKGLSGDSIHFIIQGVPYSAEFDSVKKGEEIIYSSNPPEIKQEPGDFFIFPYPVQVRAKEKNEKIIPIGFHTKLLNAKTKKSTSIEGELREK